ncbi:hypothetical protein Scep_002569 [Stephania cephalantha]|uniref:Uncharacterized protein n=1 Tax=Stephania cephalantha TaxID=152367 RepID=A0AAP0Q536_9MAGN
MISGGFSLEVFKQWAPSEMNLIALPGQGGVKGDQRLRRSRVEQRRRRSRAQPVAAEDRGGDQERAAAARGPSSGGGQLRRRPVSAAQGASDLADHGVTGSSGGGSTIWAATADLNKGEAATDPKKGAAATTNSGAGGE